MKDQTKTVALLLLGVALGTFAGIPAAHLIGHEDDHSHFGAAVVEDTSLEQHHNSEAPSNTDTESAHGSGDMSHFSASLLAAEVPVLETVSDPVDQVPPQALLAADLPDPQELDRARAPPASR